MIFEPGFAIQNCCECDYIQMNITTTEGIKRIAKWFGDDKPWHAGAVNEDIWVWFKSDNSVEAAGYNLTYQAGRQCQMANGLYECT